MSDKYQNTTVFVLSKRDRWQLQLELFSCNPINLRINDFETLNISVPHHNVHCSRNRWLYQQFAVNSTSMFDTIFLGNVANGVTGVLGSCIQCLK